MDENVEFIYKEEFWYISAFINTSLVNGQKKSQELEKYLNLKLHDLQDKDIFKKELKEQIIDMAHNITLKCRWVPYLENFPYRDENSDQFYDTLGYFQIEVEYFKLNPDKKGKLKPILIQQIPYIALNQLREFEKIDGKTGINIDIESPIYVFVTSNNTKPSGISWTKENIDKYKRTIASWTVIYTGQWEDYHEDLFTSRIKNNLSNRLSELHFIRRNSGFVYMAPENYKAFFKSYMVEFVLNPTSKMRAVQFALRSINESLDLLFLKTQTDILQDLEMIENKIKNLRLLRGLIQTQLSAIYNELDYNRREHYTKVLKHLLNEFEINNIVCRINEKFNTIYDAIQQLYQKKNEENQKRTEKGLNLLNLLFGAGILADLAGVIMITFALQEGTLQTILLNGIISLLIITILVITVGYYIYMSFVIRKTKVIKAVDAIIEDIDQSIVLIKRKYPPFQNYYALPGGAVEKGEKKKEALLREIKEETNLNIQILSKLGVYRETGRDPRGKVVSTVYKCKIIAGTSRLEKGDDAKEVLLISKDELSKLEFAFDHKKMLKDAGIIN